MKMLYPQVIYHQRHASSLLISVLCLLCYIGGNCLTVKTCVGDVAVLPCEVDPTTDPNEITVEWSRMDLPSDQYVYFQRNGQEFIDTKNPSYEGRTSLFTGEVNKGNVSLKLSGVESSDGGIYTCSLPECQKEITVELIVEERVPDSTSTEGKEGELEKLLADTDSGSNGVVPTARAYSGIIISIVVISLSSIACLLVIRKTKNKQLTSV